MRRHAIRYSQIRHCTYVSSGRVPKCDISGCWARLLPVFDSPLTLISPYWFHRDGNFLFTLFKPFSFSTLRIYAKLKATDFCVHRSTISKR